MTSHGALPAAVIGVILLEMQPGASQAKRSVLGLTSALAIPLLTLTACRPRAPLPPSVVAQALAPYRASEEAGLGYAARHFADLYPGAGPDVLVPVRPGLGLPALAPPGASLTVRYLVRATPERAQRLAQDLTLRLEGRREPDSTAPGPVSLPVRPLVLVREKITAQDLSHGIAHLRVSARLPRDAPLGLYDLVHQRPGWRARSLSAVDLRPEPRPGEPFVFVHLTDFHQGGAPDPRLAQTLAQVARLQPRPAFAVVTGDLVELGPDGRHWAQMRLTLAQLPLPVFVTLGNHDYHRVGLGRTRAPPSGVREEAGLRSFLRTFHPFPAFRFEAGGYRFVAVDTGPCATLRSLWRGQWITTEGLSDAQVADLGRFLASPAPLGHVLLAHAPPRARLDPQNDGCDPGPHGSFLQNRRAFEEALLSSWSRRPRPIIVLHGHLHWNDLYARSPRPTCRFEVVPEPQPPMGTLPCWRPLPVSGSPLLVGTQSATKSNPLRSGGLLQPGLRFGQGAGAALGFRLLRVTGARWESALYRLYQRTTAAHRDRPEGYLPPASARHDRLPTCPSPALPPPPRPRGP